MSLYLTYLPFFWLDYGEPVAPVFLNKAYNQVASANRLTMSTRQGSPTSSAVLMPPNSRHRPMINCHHEELDQFQTPTRAMCGKKAGGRGGFKRTWQHFLLLALGRHLQAPWAHSIAAKRFTSCPSLRIEQSLSKSEYAKHLLLRAGRRGTPHSSEI